MVEDQRSSDYEAGHIRCCCTYIGQKLTKIPSGCQFKFFTYNTLPRVARFVIPFSPSWTGIYTCQNSFRLPVHISHIYTPYLRVAKFVKTFSPSWTHRHPWPSTSASCDSGISTPPIRKNCPLCRRKKVSASSTVNWSASTDPFWTLGLSASQTSSWPPTSLQSERYRWWCNWVEGQPRLGGQRDRNVFRVQRICGDETSVGGVFEMYKNNGNTMNK